MPDRVSRVRPSACRGASLLEVMLSIFLIVTMLGLAVPAVSGSLDAIRSRAAARYLTGRLGLARLEAVRRGTAVALRFEPEDTGYRMRLYIDGNGNGVRSADIGRGLDAALDAWERLDHQFPGVSFGVVPGAPPIEGGEARPDPGDPLRIGSSDTVTFSPAGTATSGTLFLRGRGIRQYAVRVLGATGRTRLFELDPAGRQWIPR